MKRPAQVEQGPVRGGVGAVARDRRSTPRPCAGPALLTTVSGSRNSPLATARSRIARIAAVTCSARTSGARTATTARDRAAREGAVDAVVGLHDRQVARQPLDARVRGVQAQRRHRQQRRSTPPAPSAETHGWRSTAPDDGGPEAGLAVRAVAAGEERHAALVHAVAELGQDGRQHRQRADDRDRHDEDRARRERLERRVAGEVHPGHRDHHGAARRPARPAPRSPPRRPARRRCRGRARARRARGAGRTSSSRPRRRGRPAGSPTRSPGRPATAG